MKRILQRRTRTPLCGHHEGMYRPQDVPKKGSFPGVFTLPRSPAGLSGLPGFRHIARITGYRDPWKHPLYTRSEQVVTHCVPWILAIAHSVTHTPRGAAVKPLIPGTPGERC